MADYSKYTREELEARLKFLEEENNLGLLFTDRFNSVLESASIGFWTYNVSTGAMDFSPSWYKMMGYTIEDFDDPADLRADMIHPEDSYYSEKFMQIVNTGDIPETDDKIRLRTKSGEWKWVYSKITTVEKGNQECPLYLTGIIIDIDSIQKNVDKIQQQQRLLMENEKKFRTIIENLPIGFILYDQDKKIIEINNHLFEVMRITEEQKPSFIQMLEYNSRPELELIEKSNDKSELEFTYDPYAKRLIRGISVCLDCLYLNVRVVILRGSNNRINGYIALLTDKTELYKYYRQIEEKNILWSHAADMANIAYWKFYINRHVNNKLIISDEFYKFFPPEYASWDKKSLHKLYRQCIKNQFLNTDFFNKVANAPFNEINEETYEVEIGGNQHFHTVRWEKILAGGEEYVMGVTVDVTEMMKKENQLRESLTKLSLVLDSGEIYPWYMDADLKNVELDANITPNILKEKPTDFFVMQNMINCIHPDDREYARLEMGKLLGGEKKRICIEHRTNILNGQYTWVELVGVVCEYDKFSKPKRVLGFTRNIQEKKDKEQQLIEALRKAEESDRLKSSFLANVSHEIRTPLNAIVGFTGVIASTEDPVEREEYFKIVRSNNDLLLSLINDILDLSKIESGRTVFHNSLVNLNEICIELQHTHQYRITNNTKILFEPKETPIFLVTDYNRLQQVLSNLLTNAIKHTEKGSITIDYKEQDTIILFSITDTGHGIPQDKVETIFDRFVKVDEFSEGFGLGLSICQSIVEKQNGTIGVESKVGKGSRFWFTLPYIKEMNE